MEIVNIDKEKAAEIIENREERGLFWHIDNENRYVAIDNTTGDAWTEDFETKEECFAYLMGPDIDSVSVKISHR